MVGIHGGQLIQICAHKTRQLVAVRRGDVPIAFGAGTGVLIGAGRAYTLHNQRKLVANGRVALSDGSFRQLDNVLCSPVQPAEPVRHQAGLHVEHTIAFADEKHIDREPHTKGVYGLRWHDDEASTRLQAVLAEQSNHPAKASFSQNDPFADDGTLGFVQYLNGVHVLFSVLR
jgi:hypothetical protein